MRTCRILVWIIYFTSVVAMKHDALTAVAQAPDSKPIQLIPRTEEQREAKYKAEHRISLTARVTDSEGKPVTGLKSDDFKLFDNQKPQEISKFHELDARTLANSAHLIVVLDGINDGGSTIGPLKKDVDRFLSNGSGPLPSPLSLAFVSESGATVTQPTTDRALIKSRLAQLARRPHQVDCLLVDFRYQSDCRANHFTASNRALRQILENRRNTAGLTVLIWVGRGWPLAPEQKGYYRSVLAEINTDLRQGDVILDAISPDGFTTPKRFPKPAPGPGTPDVDAEKAMTLEALVLENGGEANGKIKNFADAIWKIVEEPGGLYLMSFDSNPSTTVDEYHSLELKVNRQNMTVRTATGYYAEP